jgi:hypothetical protein
VALGVIAHVLGLACDLAATEEGLGVAVLVKDHTKSRGHVHSIALLIEVDILSRVLASVTVDILK